MVVYYSISQLHSPHTIGSGIFCHTFPKTMLILSRLDRETWNEITEGRKGWCMSLNVIWFNEESHIMKVLRILRKGSAIFLFAKCAKTSGLSQMYFTIFDTYLLPITYINLIVLHSLGLQVQILLETGLSKIIQFAC